MPQTNDTQHAHTNKHTHTHTQAIKQGAEEQRTRHEQQIARLEAEVSLLRSEREMMRGGPAPRKRDGALQRQTFQHYNVSELTRDVERITRQLIDEASQLMLAMAEEPHAGGEGCGPVVPQDDALRSQISELETQRQQMQEEIQVLQEDCADLAGEVNRLEDLNFLAETALLKYAGELEDTRTALKAATARVQDLEATFAASNPSTAKKAAKQVSSLELNLGWHLKSLQVCDSSSPNKCAWGDDLISSALS